MTSHSTAEVARIAAGLTKAQREAVLLLSGEFQPNLWKGKGRAASRQWYEAMRFHQNLYEREWRRWWYALRLTPFGLAVRAHLEAKL